MKRLVELNVNGERKEIAVAANRTWLQVLREDLGLTGTKRGCDLGGCAACTVLVDGKAGLSCLQLAVEMEGKRIETIEGLSSDLLVYVQASAVRKHDFHLVASCGTPALFESPLYTQGAVDNRSLRAAQIRSIGGQAVRPFAPAVRQAGVRWQSWRYVAGGSRQELYDLRSDPGETRNLAATRPEVAARLSTELRSWVAAYPLRQTGVAKVNAELQETLRALGYVR